MESYIEVKPHSYYRAFLSNELRMISFLFVTSELMPFGYTFHYNGRRHFKFEVSL